MSFPISWGFQMFGVRWHGIHIWRVWSQMTLLLCALYSCSPCPVLSVFVCVCVSINWVEFIRCYIRYDPDIEWHRRVQFERKKKQRKYLTRKTASTSGCRRLRIFDIFELMILNIWYISVHRHRSRVLIAVIFWIGKHFSVFKIANTRQPIPYNGIISMNEFKHSVLLFFPLTTPSSVHSSAHT